MVKRVGGGAIAAPCIRVVYGTTCDNFDTGLSVCRLSSVGGGGRGRGEGLAEESCGFSWIETK